jgi:uncharacterized membrane protein
MDRFNQLLLIAHFLGLALGFSVSFANIAMSGLLAKATPQERVVLSRFPPVMSRVGTLGLIVLWTSGLILVYTRWNGFGTLPWQFHVKLTAVVLLTITVSIIHRLQHRVRGGDASAAVRIETLGKLATALAVIAVVFAVLTFD